MSFHRNAKLGLAGRYALVSRDRGWDDAEGGRGRLQRLAGDGASLVASLAGGRRGARATLSCLFDRSSRPHRSPRQLAPELAGGGSALSPPDRLGAAPGRGRDRLRALDGLEGAPAGRALAAAAAAREPANSYEWPCPGDLLHMDTCEYARFRGLATASPATVRRRTASTVRAATTSCTRSSTTTPGSPTPRSTPTRRRRPSSASSSARSPSSPATASPRAADDRRMKSSGRSAAAGWDAFGWVRVIDGAKRRPWGLRSLPRGVALRGPRRCAPRCRARTRFRWSA